MPRPLRAELFVPSEVCIVHCVQRCVRRAFLAGDKYATKTDKYVPPTYLTILEGWV